MTSLALNSEIVKDSPSATVLAIGPWNRGEFAIVRDQIAESQAWSVVVDCETASELLCRDEMLVEFVFLAQPLPGMYQQAEIEALRRLAPLAQLLVVAGSWCEGELRTGKPLTGVVRLYWHELAHWWRMRACGTASGPLGLDNLLVPRHEGFDLKLQGLVAIHSPTLGSFEAMATGLIPYGLECYWDRDSTQVPKGAQVGIWDGVQLDSAEWNHLQSFAAEIQSSGGSLIVLLHYPRKEHVARLQSLGCEAVFGKPYIVAELVSLLGRLRDKSPSLLGRG
jgi:hypothetical protein